MKNSLLHINIPPNAIKLLKLLYKHNFEAYICGGTIRDAVLGRPVHDWDICTNAKPEEILKVFKNYQVIETGIKYGTVTVMVEGTGYEITTYRVEPVSMERIQSEFVKMAASENFYAMVENHQEVFGSFIPEIWNMVGFEQNNPYHCYDVFKHTVVALKYCDSEDIITRLAVFFHDFGKPSTYEEDENGIGHFHGHGAVSAEIADKIMRRMHFDNEIRNKVVELVKYHDASLETTDKCVKRWLNRVGEEQFRRLLDIRLADIGGQSRLDYNERVGKVLHIKMTLEKVLKEESCFSLKDLAVNGRDLIEIGFKPGKELGEVLGLLLNGVIDGVWKNEKDILLEQALLFNGLCSEAGIRESIKQEETE